MPAARTLRLLAALCPALLLTAPGFAASPRDTLLVTPAWVAQHLTDPKLVLLHIGVPEEYAAKHIPGARFVDLYQDLSVSEHTATGKMLEMQPKDVLHDRLAALGIADDSRVVVYYAKDWVSPATRVLFTLDYAGLGERSAMLDGGMEAWAREGHPVTDVIPAPKTGTLAPLTLRPIVVDADFVKAQLGAPGVAVVDGRSSSFYDGVETGGAHGASHKTGHIAGAHSVPFTSVFDDQNRLRSAEELTALFTQAGVKPNDTVVGYCHIGQQATAMLFAARSLGHKVLLYDGSFEDWSRHDASYPVEGPKVPAAQAH